MNVRLDVMMAVRKCSAILTVWSGNSLPVNVMRTSPRWSVL